MAINVLWSCQLCVCVGEREKVNNCNRIRQKYEKQTEVLQSISSRGITELKYMYVPNRFRFRFFSSFVVVAYLFGYFVLYNTASSYTNMA